MGCSPPGFPVLHHLPEFAQTHQTHVHGVGDVIQPSQLGGVVAGLNKSKAQAALPTAKIQNQ